MRFIPYFYLISQTKHFQTLFWTPDIRLVDCPGLVLPDLVPVEMQVRFCIQKIVCYGSKFCYIGVKRYPSYRPHARASIVYSFCREPSSTGTDLWFGASHPVTLACTGQAHMARGDAAGKYRNDNGDGVDSNGYHDSLCRPEGLGYGKSRET